MFKEDFMLSNLSVEGEVSNCSYNHTGHVYFTLKDQKTSISAVMFAGNVARGLKFKMKDGDKVVVHGYVGVYQVSGRYQIYARSIELAGQGDLYLRFEQLKKELEEMGMFDPSYKKPIPSFVQRIGIVTAPTGAAVHDIIRVSKRRNPYVELILYPAQVQGEGAARSIATGIATLDEMGLDVLIVGRGGGSIEDLWAFNEEIVARAVFNCATPVISAVGHEVDFTICDFVADKRAATPSQAAELANFVYDEYVNSLNRYYDKLSQNMEYAISVNKQRMLGMSQRLALLHPAKQIAQQKLTFNQLLAKLEQAMQDKLEISKNNLKLKAARLDGLSPAKKLTGGFGYSSIDGKALCDANKVSKGDILSTRISNGLITSTVTAVELMEEN